MKTCITCKHYRHRLGSYDKCNFRPSPVDGSPSSICEFERSRGSSCGPEGKNWESEPSIVEIVVRWFKGAPK